MIPFDIKNNVNILYITYIIYITFNDIVHIPDPIGEVIMNEDPSKYTCSGFTSTKANAACTKKAKSFNKMGKPVCGFHRDK